MPRRPPRYTGYSARRRPTRRVKRKSAAARGYGRPWRKASAAFLAENPLCRACRQRGRDSAATQTDHIIPHRGDPELFWDRSNWQPLCDSCHGRKTAAGL